MKYLIIILSIIGAFSVNGQAHSSENMVLQFIQEAVERKKLPKEVINIKDSTRLASNLIVIQTTKENGLDHGVYFKHNDIDYKIWTAEELFTDAPYWITPLNIKVAKNKDHLTL
jgi:hypothetical protein